MKKEIKIALVIDNYKLADKEKWWNESLKHKPEIERDYVLDREEQGAGLSKGTTALYRYYVLKEKA